jgi:8-oxo-dGTP pyrophosphatase MutT (NUDIX family)
MASSSNSVTFESNYFFPQVFAVKALIHNGKSGNEQRFLFLTEPETSSWKPGRLGLPGGKSDPGEDWLTTLHREIREELDIEVTPEGIFSLEEIVLVNPKTNREQLTHHVIALCQLKDSAAAIADNAKWYSLTELQAKSVDDLTEFYFPTLFSKIAKGLDQLAPLDFIHVMNGVKNNLFQDWFLK